MTWAPRVERWRDLCQQNGGDIPVEFLLAWINTESAGDTCSYTQYHESGIFQLMPGDNMNVAGATEAQLRVGCDQTPNAELTDDQKAYQVTTGVAYVNWCRDTARSRLASAGVSWSESTVDFWKLVKMVHVAPARLSHLSSSTPDWDSFSQACSDAGDTPSSWLANADKVGGAAFDGGSPIDWLLPGSIDIDTLVLLAALGAALFYLQRYA